MCNDFFYQEDKIYRKSKQGNHGYSDNQRTVIQGQKPHMENRHTQQRK